MVVIFQPKSRLKSLISMHNHLYELVGEGEDVQDFVELYEQIDEEVYYTDSIDVEKDGFLSRKEILQKLNNLYNNLEHMSHNDISNEIDELRRNID